MVDDSINCILQYKTVLQAHSGFDSVLGAAGGNRCWLVVAPWWQTQEHLTRLILALHSSMSVPPMRGHLPCRETCLDTEVSVEGRYYCMHLRNSKLCVCVHKESVNIMVNNYSLY